MTPEHILDAMNELPEHLLQDRQRNGQSGCVCLSYNIYHGKDFPEYLI